MHDSLHTTILSMVLQATALLDVQSYRPGYLPYPARVTLQTTAGKSVVYTLKVGEDADRLGYEARVLQALTDLHLPVPKVISGPVTTEIKYKPVAVLLVSELPGQPLPWLGLTDLTTAHRTCQLLQEAVDALHALTPRVQSHPVAAILPSITLASELQSLMAQAGPWLSVPAFTDALTLVQTLLPRSVEPLVFSNGDYNPLNFLVEDDALSGWIDFEHACFEDPYIGFAKFVLWADDAYGWGAGARAGLVERYLYEHNVAPAAFLVRLLLRGLCHVQGTDPDEPPRYVMNVIADAVGRLRKMLG